MVICKLYTQKYLANGMYTQLLLTSGISRLGTGLPSFALGPSFMALQGIHDASLSNFEDSN